MTHELKAWPEFFGPLKRGTKKFELRYNDRNFRVGDTLRLREWDNKTGYTGRELSMTVTFLLHGEPWLSDGYVAMSLAPSNAPAEARAARRLGPDVGSLRKETDHEA